MASETTGEFRSGRPEPVLAGNDAEQLIGFLERQRATFEWKLSNLDGRGLERTFAPSEMTLGGLLLHVAAVEEKWFGEMLWGPEEGSSPLTFDEGSAWQASATLAPQELMEIWRTTVERSRSRVQRAIERDGLDYPAAFRLQDGSGPDLRYLVVTMIEEYNRHNGHIDLMREAVDGLVGTDPPDQDD